MKKSALWLTLALAATSLAGTSAAQAPQPSTDVQAHISAVENGLLPPVVIEGDANPGHALAERMAALKVPGVSIAVMRNGKVEWAKGYGVAGASGAAVNTDTLFQAGSISKPVAALAALRLVEQGKLSLDDILKDTKRGEIVLDPMPGSGIVLTQGIDEGSSSQWPRHGSPGCTA